MPGLKLTINDMAHESSTILTSLVHIEDTTKHPCVEQYRMDGQSITQSVQKHYWLAGISMKSFQL